MTQAKRQLGTGFLFGKYISQDYLPHWWVNINTKIAMSCSLAENVFFMAFSACLFCPAVSVVFKYAKTHQYLVENSFNFHLPQSARCKYRLKRMHLFIRILKAQHASECSRTTKVYISDIIIRECRV